MQNIVLPLRNLAVRFASPPRMRWSRRYISAIPAFAGMTAQILLGVMCAPLNAQAPKETLLKASSESRLWIDGDSTLHKFTSSTSKVRAEMTIDAAVPSADQLLDSVKHGKAKTLSVTIAVEDLKSGDKGLDKNMYKAMQADKYPEIRFRLDRYDTVKSTGSAIPVKAFGKLTIAAAEKDVALEGIVAAASSTIRMKGSYELFMKEYGIEPPKLMLGAIKVDNRVVIGYDLILAPEK